MGRMVNMVHMHGMMAKRMVDRGPRPYADFMLGELLQGITGTPPENFFY